VTPRILVSAGEPSGDLHGAAVVEALFSRFPQAVIEAFGGPRMAAAGATVLWPMERYTVMGFAEIVHKIPAHYRLLRELRRRFQARRYDLVVLIDYPGFHLRVAESARRAGVKVLYYIAPQLWAWRPQRAPRFKAAVDQLAVIFPFEATFFPTVGIRARYVGHPLVDRGAWPNRTEARERLGIGAGERVLAVFPGSRGQELARHWVPFRDAALRVLELGQCDRVVVAGLPGVDYPGSGPILIRRAEPHEVLAAADAVIAKSGTTTLEATLTDTPMVVAYRVHWLTGWFARRLIRVPWVSPVNLIAGEQVVEELLQDDLTVERLARAAGDLLNPTHPRTVAQRAALARVRDALGGPGAAGRVAELAAELLAR
jgi:lipid-A-disaccharide synthase